MPTATVAARSSSSSSSVTGTRDVVRPVGAGTADREDERLTRPAPVRVGSVVLALTLLGAAVVASVVLGARDVGPTEIWNGLRGGTATVGEAAVFSRLPRTALALLVGGALGLSGAVMQGVTRNPLADPGILGVTGGASLFVVVGIAYFSLGSASSYIWVAILGAGASATLVYAVASTGTGRRGGPSPLRLALSGAVTAAAAASLVTAVLLPRTDVMTQFRFWSVGGVGGGTWSSISLVAPFLLAGAVICLMTAPALDALALGDDMAAGLGTNVVRARLVAGLGAVVLAGAATAVAGPLVFVGLVVPHVCRLLVGERHIWLLPTCVVVGAALLVLSDVAARLVIRPAELDVGIITALVGGPVFIWMVTRMRTRAL
ncbi:iron ABC transporter permease [Nocardioidaceae bacterium]|nr:iron ABC transporter permease [Nocardioidaceae bacterium]